MDMMMLKWTVDQLILLPFDIAIIVSKHSTVKTSNDLALAVRDLATIPLSNRYSIFVSLFLSKDFIGRPERENLTFISSEMAEGNWLNSVIPYVMRPKVCLNMSLEME